MSALETLWGKKVSTPTKPEKTERAPAEPVMKEFKKVAPVKTMKVGKLTAEQIEFEKNACVLLKKEGL